MMLSGGPPPRSRCEDRCDGFGFLWPSCFFGSFGAARCSGKLSATLAGPHLPGLPHGLLAMAVEVPPPRTTENQRRESRATWKPIYRFAVSLSVLTSPYLARLRASTEAVNCLTSRSSNFTLPGISILLYEANFAKSGLQWERNDR